MAGPVSWAFVDRATIALVSFVAADPVAALPTLRKSWLAPQTESPRVFFTQFAYCAIALVTLNAHHGRAPFPGSTLVMDLLIGPLIVSRVGPRARRVRRVQGEDDIGMVKESASTLDQATARGRALRQQCPRKSLATLGARPDGYDPVARLMWQGESRVSELLPLRYQRMLVNPSTFYRGAALLMAEDLAAGPSTPLEVQICGDAHLSNFNLFSSPERHLVFDVNDFDETALGPFEWDVKRLATSLALASQQVGHSHAQQEAIARNVAREYRLSIQRFAGETRLGVWYSTLDVDAVVHDLGGFFSEGEVHKVDEVIGHAQDPDTKKAFAKLVTYGTEGPRIASDPPLLVPLHELETGTYVQRELLDELLAGYARSLSSDRRSLLAQFTPVDVARKVVGVGSVGTECYVVLLVGRDEQDPFFLQIKEATASVVATALGRTTDLMAGERVVRGQRLMQATSDVFLGWDSLDTGNATRDFYVRQLYDNKAAILTDQLDESLLVIYGRICAWVLARAHARSGRAAEIAGYLGTSEVADEALTTFSMAYVERTKEDYKALKRAASEGRIVAAS